MVTGSRTWRDYARVREAIADEHGQEPIEVLIHGGCSGADMLADRACRSLGIPTEVHIPRWREEGKKAGVLRNIRMIEDAKPDRVLAFRCRGVSRGTDHAIHHAQKRALPIRVVWE